MLRIVHFIHRPSCFCCALQRQHTADLTLSFGDGLKAVCLCLFELVFLRFILAWVRCTAFIGYRKKKLSWGRIERRKIDLK